MQFFCTKPYLLMVSAPQVADDICTAFLIFLY